MHHPLPSLVIALVLGLSPLMAQAASHYHWDVLQGPNGERTFDDRVNRAYCFQGEGRTEQSRVDNRFCRCTSGHATSYQRVHSLLDASMLQSRRHPAKTTCFETLRAANGRLLSVGGPALPEKCDEKQTPPVPYDFCRQQGLMSTELLRELDQQRASASR